MTRGLKTVDKQDLLLQVVVTIVQRLYVENLEHDKQNKLRF